VTVNVLDLQPAVYTSDGKQGIVVHNVDYSLATEARPLERGEFAFLYAAGLGRVANQPASGNGAPASPLARAQADVRVTLGGLPCDVPFAGLAPGLVGVYQVNFRVPPNVPAGSQDLVVTAGQAASPAVTVAVR
jgi:uncharacterized protein (TIGR03437 family)